MTMDLHWIYLLRAFNEAYSTRRLFPLVFLPLEEVTSGLSGIIVIQAGQEPQGPKQAETERSGVSGYPRIFRADHAHTQPLLTSLR